MPLPTETMAMPRAREKQKLEGGVQVSSSFGPECDAKGLVLASTLTRCIFRLRLPFFD